MERLHVAEVPTADDYRLNACLSLSCLFASLLPLCLSPASLPFSCLFASLLPLCLSPASLPLSCLFASLLPLYPPLYLPLKEGVCDMG